MRTAALVVMLVLVARVDAQSDLHRPVAPVFSKGYGAFDEAGGEALYRAICQGCHMLDGRGATGAGRYPALAANPRVASAEYVAVTVLAGRRNMPAFGAMLDDRQVADVVGYVRARFGNADTTPLSPADVAALRTRR